MHFENGLFSWPTKSIQKQIKAHTAHPPCNAHVELAIEMLQILQQIINTAYLFS